MWKNQKICYARFLLQKIKWKKVTRTSSSAIFIGNGIFPDLKIADDDHEGVGGGVCHSKSKFAKEQK